MVLCFPPAPKGKETSFFPFLTLDIKAVILLLEDRYTKSF